MRVIHLKSKLILSTIVLLVMAVPASAATPKQTIAKLRAQVASLTKQRDAVTKQRNAAQATLAAAQTAVANIAAENARNSNAVTAANLALQAANSGQASATSFLADCRVSLAVKTSQFAGAQSALAGPIDQQINSMDAGGLWAILATAKARMDSVGGAGYTSSLRTSPGATTYSFDRLGP